MNAFFSIGMTFAFWASSVDSSGGNADGNIAIGDWGIPIFTPAEFYTFATKTDSVATDFYYLANDIDFSSFTWEYNALNNNVTFRGTLNGNGKTISNLTVTNNSTTYSYNGIFPRINGGTVYNITFDNVQIITNLSGTTQRSGLVSGNASGSTVTLDNITVINSGVQGNSTNGVGGLIGNVQGATTILNIYNVKATNLKVFNDNAYVGGLVGRIATSGGRVNMYDIDFQGEVYSNLTGNTSSSYAGGLIGFVRSGAFFTLERAIVEATFQNTLVTASNFLGYTNRYLGGFIGYNAAVSANVNLTNAFFTGSLYTRIDARRNDVGTVSGRDATQATLSNVFHSFVAYRSTGGGINYTETTQTGQMATVVNPSAMPTVGWWDSAYAIFDAVNDLWAQDVVTGRLYLIR